MGKKKFFVGIGLFAAVIVLSISLVTAKNSQSTKDLEKTTFQVANLSCGSCLTTIEEELKKYDGMVDLSANLSLGLISIDHTTEFSKEQIAAAITKSGYPAKILSEKELLILSKQAVQRGSGCGSRGGGCGGPKGCSVSATANPESQPEKTI